MNIPPQIIEKINQSLSGMDILKDIGYKVESIQVTGSLIRCFCPIHKETIFRSMTLDDSEHKYKCGYSLCPGYKGGSYLDFYSIASHTSLETAILHWSKELKLEEEIPGSEEWLNELMQKGEKSIQEKNWEAAKEIYQQIIRLLPERLDLQKKVAELYESSEEIPEAVKQYITISKIALQNLNYEEVENSLTHALRLSPESDEITQELIELYIQQNKKQEATKLLEKQLEKTENPDKKRTVLDKLTSLEQEEIRWMEALAQLDEEAGESENAISQYQKILKIHETNKDLQKTESILGRLSVLDPENLEWKTKLALSCLESGEKEKGYKQTLGLVDIYKEKKDFKSAIKLVNEVKVYFPDSKS